MSFPETTSSDGVGMVDEPGAEEVVLVAATQVVAVALTRSMVALVIAKVLWSASRWQNSCPHMW